MRHPDRRRFATLFVTLLTAASCAGDPAGPASKDEDFGMEGELLPTPAPGKEDSQKRKGLLVATNTTRTQVWTARNKWEDTTTPAARAAGLAWPADSGLTWDQKYGKWLESLERTRSTEGWFDTYVLTTPWGKTLPAPALECAETSIFLRITFAAWYELPLFFEAVDSQGRRIYIGHNGVRTAAGRYASTPEFAIVYKDYSSMTPAAYGASWPKDTALRARKLWDSVDEQPMIGPGATIGTYLDEIHLNKRVGHFTVFALNYLSSINIVDTANSYNLVPEALRAGDMLLHRWQKNGIGDTKVIKDVNEIGEGNFDVTVVSGSMPRRQGKWETGAASKQNFIAEDAGGPGTNIDGDEYVKLGGGLKRWRVAKNIGGYWTNTFMAADEASWINSTDYPRIAARVARFETLLGEVSPEQTRTELLAQIEDSRRHLSNYPASCSARERRERAFEQLYDLSARRFNQTRAQVDRAYRQPIDYTFAELEYSRSKTCCWNSSNAAMFAVIRDYAEKERADAAARGQCVAPTVFMNQSDGYARWKAFAEQTGRGAQWKDWSEDETCGQRDVAADSERDHAWTDLCILGGAGGGGSCGDSLEPSSMASPRALAAGSYANLRICTGDEDQYTVSAAATVTIRFSHAAGDLDMQAFDAGGREIGKSDSSTDSETLRVPAGTRIRVYGYAGATNSYSLQIQ